MQITNNGGTLTVVDGGERLADDPYRRVYEIRSDADTLARLEEQLNLNGLASFPLPRDRMPAANANECTCQVTRNIDSDDFLPLPPPTVPVATPAVRRGDEESGLPLPPPTFPQQSGQSRGSDEDEGLPWPRMQF